MNDTSKLADLWTRKTRGEKTKALASEVGLGTQGLIAAWKKAGFYGGQAEVVEAEAVVEAVVPADEFGGSHPQDVVAAAQEEAVAARAAEMFPAEKPVTADEAAATAGLAPTAEPGLYESEAGEVDEEAVVAKPQLTCVWVGLKLAEREKETWLTDRQLYGMKKIAGGGAVVADLLGQLKKKGLAEKDGGGVQKLTGRGEAALSAGLPALAKKLAKQG